MCFLILVGSWEAQPFVHRIIFASHPRRQPGRLVTRQSLIHLALPRTTAQLFRWSVSYLEVYGLNPCCATRQQLQHDSRKSSVGGTYKMVLPSYFCWWPQGTIDLLTIKPGYCSYDTLQYVAIQFCCPLGGPPCKDGPWYYIPWAKHNPLGQHFCGMGVPLPRQQLLGGPVTIETAKYKPSWICWRNPTPTSKKPYRFASRTGSPIEQKKSHRQTAKQSLETWRSQA